MIRWIQEIRALSKRISKAWVDAYAAQSAFYLIMGFIPFIMLLGDAASVYGSDKK
ncbi:MAG: hypothetical protein ACLR6B_01890 [Blautia sp.]